MNTDIKVLIVDDYKTMLNINRGILTQIGFKDIDEAANGEEALKLFNENDYGLIVSDWNMGPVDGYELLKSIRANSKNRNVPFIMATTEGRPEKVRQAKDAGVDDYIVKPFDGDKLKEKIENVLN